MNRNRYLWIYQPAGRAREYADWALNLYNGCTHGCVYCYAPLVLRKAREDFHSSPASRRNAIDQIERSAKLAAGRVDRVLLCFTCDPYPPLGDEPDVTRAAIEILHHHGIYVTILTKGGFRSVRDFDLLGSHDAYATTLAVLQSRQAAWEPNAAPISERLQALALAHARGIETWGSFEPVVWPAHTFQLLARAHDALDHCKVGPLNYESTLPDGPQYQVPTVDWRQFADEFERRCNEYGIRCYLKQDLRERAGRA